MSRLFVLVLVNMHGRNCVSFIVRDSTCNVQQKIYDDRKKRRLCCSWRLEKNGVAVEDIVGRCTRRFLVGLEVTAHLVSAFILSRRDYCNSVLAGLPRCTTEPLQRVLNAAARFVLNLLPHEHITPALQQLHWLPIDYRITYKLSYYEPWA